jgi:hypothetical protein
VLGEGGRVSLLDLEALRQALNHEALVSAPTKRIDERIEAGRKHMQADNVRWVHYLKYVASGLSGKPMATHESLAHWVVSGNPGRHDVRDGRLGPELWVERRPGVWGHQVGPHVSYLMLKYPLEGEFSVTLRSLDKPWEDGASVFGGYFVEFKKENDKLIFHAAGERDPIDIATTAMKAGEMNTFRFDCKDGNILLTIGDGEFSTPLAPYATAYPFFGMASFGFRMTEFDGIVISGDVRIPREVNLVSPMLLGWSGRFMGNQLPRLALSPGNVRLADRKDPARRDHWRCVDGEIRSVDIVAESSATAKEDNAEPYTEKRREGLVEYLRPLCDGEQISLEFYYEPGKFTLAPSIGRIAVLLEEPEVALHWITCGNSLWTGVEETNRVVDPQAEQLETVELVNNDWNQLAVRVDEEIVTLTLNGKDVYRRRWEPEAGSNFGLFHDPTKSHVRVRNVKLSGKWPEKLPADFFEKRPEGTI